MEVSEASADQNVQKINTSESVDETTTVEPVDDNENTSKTISISETIQVKSAKDGDVVVEEVIEEVEVTDNSEGEGEEEEVVVDVTEHQVVVVDDAQQTKNNDIESKPVPVNGAPIADTQEKINSGDVEKSDADKKVDEKNGDDDDEEEEEVEEVEEEEEEEVEEAIEKHAEIIETERKLSVNEGTSVSKVEEKSSSETTSSTGDSPEDRKSPVVKEKVIEKEEVQTESTDNVTKQLASLQITEKESSSIPIVSAESNQQPLTQKTQILSEQKPLSHQETNGHCESIRKQLQEVVSDMDKAVEENHMFIQPTNLNQTLSSPSTKITSDFSNQTIYNANQPAPIYLYQEDNTSTSTYPTKPIDLKKILTPATDAEEIVPHKNRKNENVNLNGCYYEQKSPTQEQYNERSNMTQHHESKIPLKLVMDPRGVVQDVYTQGITFDPNSGMLSPDKCAELVSALYTDAPKGKGAELFAKRRKRSEKWIVDETTRSSNNPALTSYSAGPAQIYDTNQYNDFNQSTHTDQVKYLPPQPQNVPPTQQSYKSGQSINKNYAQPSQTISSYSLPKNTPQPMKWTPNSQRDLAYKPSIPQGWNAPPANLPNEMFVPPEIPLSGYTPPKTELFLPKSAQSTPSYYQPQQQQQQQYGSPTASSIEFYQNRQDAYRPAPADTYRPAPADTYHETASVPTCKKLHPSQVYSQNSPVPNFTPKPFTPSPIAHEKLAIFESNKPSQPPPPIRRPLTIPNQSVRNVSPTPFGLNHAASSYDSRQNNASWRNSNNYSQTSSITTTTSTSYGPPKSALGSPGISYDFSHQENHNRAARGWGQSKEFYRPISFTKPIPIELPYTDF